MDIYEKYLIVTLLFILAVGAFLTWAIMTGKDKEKH